MREAPTRAGTPPDREKPGSHDAEDSSAERRRLVYAPAADLDRWQCRPLGSIEALDLRDRPVGRLDGIVVDRAENRPIYLVIAKQSAADQRPRRWFLVPVGDAWFDDTERTVRIDASPGERIPFDPRQFARMTPEQADEYERRVLAACCPDVGFHRDGRPDYAKVKQFTCPEWLHPVE